jgi:hypothetical protein
MEFVSTKKKNLLMLFMKMFLIAKILQNAHIPSEVKHGYVIVGQVAGILISGL